MRFEEGGMWEERHFEIERDYECTEYFDLQPCKHCHSISERVRERRDGTTYKEKVWVCPFIVIAYNEGHCNSTGVCAECIVEAFGKIIEEEK